MSQQQMHKWIDIVIELQNLLGLGGWVHKVSDLDASDCGLCSKPVSFQQSKLLTTTMIFP